MGIGERIDGVEQLREAWQWWLGELLTLTPQRVKNYFRPDSTVLKVSATGDLSRLVAFSSLGTGKIGEISLTPEQDAKVDEFDYQDASRHPRVELFLPQSTLLSREVFLPLATENNLSMIIQYEIDKLAPFSKDDCLYCFRISGRYPEQEKVSVELWFVSRKIAGLMIQRLADLGLQPSAVYPESPGAEVISEEMNMLPPSERPQPEPMLNREIKRAALASFLLAILVFALPAWYLQHSSEQLQRKIDEVKAEAMDVAEKRGVVMSHVLAQQAIATRKNTEPGMLELLQELTQLLPDHTYVSRLRVEAGEVTIQGESSKASELIELLEQSDRFNDVSFRSSITRNPTTSKEKYEIEMSISRVGS